MSEERRYIFFDESGNLGSRGRYFVIACIETANRRSFHLLMKRKLLQAKKLFPVLGEAHAHEIKAKDAYPCVKYHILESIVRKDVKVSYIVADLKHVDSRLLKEKNIFYNYLMKILVSKIVTSKDRESFIVLQCDNKDTKVGSVNSFSDYIKLYLNYERGLGIDIKVEYLDSDARDAYVIQAADYVANAIYAKYEFHESLYFDLLVPALHKTLEFPWQKFGN